MHNDWTRREVVRAGAVGGVVAAAAGLGWWPRRVMGQGGSVGGSAGGNSAGAGVSAGRKRSIRLVHMTDMHIQPERRAFEGVGACLRNMQSMEDKPALILTGGDLIMDSFDQGAERTRELWALWTRVIKDECSLPVEHCLGNHDIWGWNKKQSKTTGEEAQWGKRWALDVLGLERPYRTFDRAGWRFVVLDSVHPLNEGYVGRLDEEQFAWLERTLAATPAGMPVLLLSHIPILSVTPIALPKDDVVAQHSGPVSQMMSDMPRLVRLFDKHRNVKVCLSGHMHMLDRVEFQGVTYMCDGAVCGAWWKGAHNGCGEGYAVIDLFDDGSVERAYRSYGWKAEV